MHEALAREAWDFFAELADIAADAVLPHFRSQLAIEDKGRERFDPVTEADRGAERALRRAIRTRYPDHAILGEEFGASFGSARYRWVIDPIDGTKAFVCGLPTWGTLIALCDGSVPLFGMMSQPFVGERFIGGFGEAWLVREGERRALRTRATVELAQAYLFATAPEMFNPEFEWPAFSALSQRVRITRYGVDCYAYCLLAAGYTDLVVEAGLGFYDIAALVPIVEAAGGVVTDWQGRAVREGGRIIAAANARLHAQALEVLRAVAEPQVS